MAKIVKNGSCLLLIIALTSCSSAEQAAVQEQEPESFNLFQLVGVFVADADGKLELKRVEDSEVERIPKAIGSPAEFFRGLGYPEEARRNQIEGVTRMHLTVRSSGEIEDLEIIDKLGHGIEDLIIGFLENGSFLPGIYLGETVAMRVEISVPFQLP